MSGPRRLSVPRRVSVSAGDDGHPLEVDGRAIDARPLRRRYWEVVTTCGRDEVVFHDLLSGRWWRQR
jgi:hypothetical protein